MKARVRRRAWLLGVAVIILATCVIRVPRKQEVQVRLARSGSPLSFESAKLVEVANEQPCDEPGVQGVTNATGAFSGHRVLWSSLIHLLLVHVSHEAICVRAGGGWKAFGVAPYGPAPAELEVTCDLAQDSGGAIPASRYPCRPR
jgi:hypothetical protein